MRANPSVRVRLRPSAGSKNTRPVVDWTPSAAVRIRTLRTSWLAADKTTMGTQLSKTARWCASMLAFALLHTGVAAAQQQPAAAGTIKVASGGASILRNGSSIPVKVGDRV